MAWMIKAVIFDVDGVLINSFEANLKFYQNLLSYAGYKPPTRKIYLKMYHMTMFDVIKALTNSKDINEINRIWLIGKNREVPYPNELVSSPKNFEQVIIKLNKKYILGIVTNRIIGGVFKLPNLEKFENYFKVVVYYEDTVKHKPDPEPLLLAVKKLNLKPKEVVYIGDAESDIKAAKAAEMKIVIYSQDQLKGADKLTSSFNKLPDLIESLN